METIKKAIRKLVGFGQNLESALKDNRVTLMEGIGLTGNLGGAVYFIIQNLEDFTTEIENMTDKQHQKLVDFVEAECNLDDEHAEEIVMDAFNLLFSLLEFVKTLKNK